MLFLNFNFSKIQLHILKRERRRRGGGGRLRDVNTTYMREHYIQTEAKRVRTDLWGEPVADRVHVVAGCRGAHESIGVAGEAVAIG